MSSDPTSPDPYLPGALPIGTRLGEFEVRKVLGIGGFGIVYLAFDHQLEREVAIKEYMPSSLAGRTATLHVSLLSQSNADTFALGLRSFINEGRLLARFDHPSLVKVYRFWEENSTAYMAMPLYRGRTVKVVRLDMPGQPDEAWIRSVLDPLLGAIERLHQEDVYHRDIAPDNILVEADGRPVLLDFGAARRVISDKSQNLTAILKPSYAPIEQYGESGSVKQGPWTDIYALGATLHFLVLGRPPMTATARAVHDESVPLASMEIEGFSPRFLRLIDWMLAPRPAERPQSVAVIRKVLAGDLAPPSGSLIATQTVPDHWDRTLPMGPEYTRTLVTGDHASRQDKTIVESLAPTLPGAADSVSGAANDVGPGFAAPPPKRGSSWLLPAAGLGATVLAGAAWFVLRGAPAPPVTSPAGPVASAPTLPPVAAPAPVAVPEAKAPTPAPVPQPQAASEPTPAVAKASAAVPAVVTAARPVPASTAKTAAKSALPRAPAGPVTGQGPSAATSTEPVPAPPPPARKPPDPVEVAKPTPAAEPDSPLSPSESCRRQVAVLKWVCMDVQCLKARYQQHPECLKLRADQEKERARAGNR